MLPRDTSAWSEARQSIVCFIHPDADCIVEPIADSGKYEPISAKDYIDKRFAETFEDSAP